MNELMKAQAEWLEDKMDCHCAMVVFRSEGVLRAESTREVTLKALDLTIDAVQRKLCKRRHVLRFIPYLGGEPEIGVSPHIHALIEVPEDVTVEELGRHLERHWCYFLKLRHGREVIASVLVREYNARNHEEQLYFCRREGGTFSWGLDKVLFDHARL